MRLQSPSGMVVIEDVDADEVAVVYRATERIGRSVSRAIDAAGHWSAGPRRL